MTIDADDRSEHAGRPEPVSRGRRLAILLLLLLGMAGTFALGRIGAIAAEPGTEAAANEINSGR